MAAENNRATAMRAIRVNRLGDPRFVMDIDVTRGISAATALGMRGRLSCCRFSCRA
jgi:hypothetical protein